MSFEKPLLRVTDQPLIDAGVAEHDAQRLTDLYQRAAQIDRLIGQLYADAETFATEVLGRPGARESHGVPGLLRRSIPDREAYRAQEDFRRALHGLNEMALNRLLANETQES